MNRILLVVDHRQNRHLLAEWLGRNNQVVLSEDDAALQEPFDIAILDGPALDRLWAQVQSRKQAEEPLFLPALLLTSRQGVDLVTRHLWRTIDEVVLRPVEKVELQARVEILLRARRLSMELRRRHTDLEAFLHAMTHELRAPLRVIVGFARELEGVASLDDQDRHCLGRIQAAATQAQGLITSLVAFGRLGHGAVRRRRVSLHYVIRSCLRHLQAEIEARNAKVIVRGDHVTLFADPTLLKLTLTNLLSNALAFVAPGVIPQVTIAAGMADGMCRIEVTDNGIGIAPEDQARLFSPFMRLHGVEEYPGIGLGLATVQKAMELTGGNVGVTSMPRAGSTFWIELSPAEGDTEEDDEDIVDR
jgi:signal transduction histidine kinase